MSARQIELSMTPEIAWQRLQAAFDQIGKIEEANDASRTLIGKARYGTNPVRLRVSILTGNTPPSAVLDIQGRGQDVWGVASRKVMDRLIAQFDTSPVRVPTDAEASATDTKDCPWCAEAVKSAAIVCRYCGPVRVNLFETDCSRI